MTNIHENKNTLEMEPKSEDRKVPSVKPNLFQPWNLEPGTSFNVTLPFQCNLCEFGFMHEQSFKVHMMGHNANWRFKCQMCDNKFNDSQKLNEHNQSVHGKVKIIKCDIEECEEVFSSRCI